MLRSVVHMLTMAFMMGWEILWALILGFFLSAMVQAIVSKEEMGRRLPDDSARTIVVACGLGAASCSYAAAVLPWRFLKTGGPAMLRAMGYRGKAPEQGDGGAHHPCCH